jgi:hypothetical protein
MKTSQDVRKSGLYSSDCCGKEMIFAENDTFIRCPKCWGLCEWDLVDPVVSWRELAEVRDGGSEAA